MATLNVLALQLIFRWIDECIIMMVNGKEAEQTRIKKKILKENVFIVGTDVRNNIEFIAGDGRAAVCAKLMPI